MRARPRGIRALAALAPLLLASCYGTRKLADPTLVIQSQAGTELGVSTDYGIVFLGQRARSGYIEIRSWFGDGPNIESTVIEPVGGGLYTAETEIRLASVPMTFFQPRPDDVLTIIGRDAHGVSWRSRAQVRSHPAVEGILLEVPSEIERLGDQIGAGVYWAPEDHELDLHLVGLVSGRLRIESEAGTQEFLTVFGPQQLWRLVTHRRDLDARKPWVYREDIL